MRQLDQDEKIISETLNSISVPEVDMKDSIMQKINNRHRVHFAKPLVIAAVLCMLFVGTALAIGLGWHSALIEYLKPSEQQMDELESSVSTSEVSCTGNGVTVTINQTLADSIGIYILYEMTVPKDITLTDDIDWRTAELNVTPVSTGGWSSTVLEQDENRRLVLIHLNQDEPIQNGYVELRLKNLAYCDYFEDSYTDIISGEWKLKWELDYTDSSKLIDLDQKVTINGTQNTWTQLVVSPLSICATIVGDRNVIDAKPIVRFKDGREIVISEVDDNAAFSQKHIDFDAEIFESRLYFRFDSIVDINDIESYTIENETVFIE